MVTLRELSFDVLFKDRATKALKRGNKQMDRMRKSTQRLRRGSERLERQQKSLKRTNETLASSWKTFAGIAGVGFAIHAVKELGKEVVGLSAKMELTRVGFEVMLGSKEKAKSLISDIKKFSLVTPFTPEQLFQATEQLLAFNFAQDEILPTLRLVGDISKGNSDKFKRLSFALSEVRANSRLMGQEARQMINAGFSPVVEIAKLTGESILEVRKRMEEGGVSFDEVRRAMVAATSKGGKFFRAMERGAMTFIGLSSTLEGFRQEVLIALGDEALEPLKELTRQMIEMSKETLEWLSVAENIEMVKDTIKDLAEVLRLALKLMAELSRATAKLSKFGRTGLGRAFQTLLTGRLPTPGQLLKKVARGGRVFSPRTQETLAPAAAAAGEPGGNVIIPKLVETVNINANSREEGQAAARGFLDELDANADTLRAQLAQ